MRWTEEDLRRIQARSLGAPLPTPTVAARPRSNGHCLGLAVRMNNTEIEYGQLLELRRRAGEIKDYGFERMKLRLANRTFYTTDYDVVGIGGEIEIHEVKGFWRDDAVVKFKVARKEFPHFRFLVVMKRRARHGGGWSIEQF